MTDDTSDTDATAGPGSERPPPARRRRRRGNDGEATDQLADRTDSCRCARVDSGSVTVDGDGDDDDHDGNGGDGDSDDRDSSCGEDGPDSTARYRDWLKLWRVVLLVILALVRLIRAL